VCACNEGFGGSACENTTITYSKQPEALPHLEIDVDYAKFTSTVLSLETLKPPSPDFYFIAANNSAASNTSFAFSVQGDGTLFGVSFTTGTGGSGQTISTGGLYIKSGGMSIVKDSLNVGSNITTAPVALISSTALEPDSTFAVCTVSSATPSQASYLLKALHEHVSVFSVKATGRVDTKGGLNVKEGCTVNIKGVHINLGGLTVASGGLKIDGDGLIVRSGLTVLSGGMQVGTDGMTVTNGVTISGDGLQVKAGGVTVTNGLAVSGGITVKSAGITVNLGGISDWWHVRAGRYRFVCNWRRVRNIWPCQNGSHGSCHDGVHTECWKCCNG
jgi:hypothetical protein